MLKTHALTTLLFLSTVTCFAQLSGVKTIPGDYATLSAAITALNTQGVGAGGVIFNIAAGYTETAPSGGIILTATGTTANPILIQKSGSGANPKIAATDAGTISTSVFGGQGDAVIIIQGSDYVTFNGIDVAATQSGIEYGYYLRKASGTNGCKNVSILNAGITMTKGTSAYVMGIYSSNNSSTSAASSAAGITITSADGINENIIFTGNTISNVFAGIAAIGYNASSPYSLYDQNFTIGAAELGNTIQNFAGNATSASYGIYTMYVKSADISYNAIANAANGGAAAIGTLSGIYFGTNASSSGNYVANNNMITLSQASTAALNFIYNGNTVTSFTANSNSFSAGSFASTATSYLIYNNNNTTSIVVNNNQTVGAITKTGEGSFYGYYNNGGGPVAATAIYSGNNFSNISITTGFNEFAGIYSSFIGNQVFTITNNTISNITGNNSSMFGIRVSYGIANSVISGNTINSISGGFTVIGLRQDFYTGNMPLNIFNNRISNVNGAQVFGLYCGGMNSTNIYKNKIYGLAGTTSSGFVSAITLVGGVSGTTNSLFNNLIGDLSAPATNSLSDAIRGISINDVNSNYNTNLYYNTIYINTASSGFTLARRLFIR